ncbi:hypothetical protein ACEPAI_3069 [Sanghuangporus weigelae]
MADAAAQSQSLPGPATAPTAARASGSDIESLEVSGKDSRKSVDARGLGNATSWREYLMQNVDPLQSTSPLASFCFMTGFIDAISFSAVFVWCGFQTGNTVQLALAIARLFSPGNTDFSFQMADRQALVSLLTFLGGASLGRIGDKLGSNTRLWLFLGTFIQALFTMGAAVTVWQGGQGSIAGHRGEPAWTNALSFVALGFASASIGLQGIMGKRVNSQFATTVVLTTVWCELLADPKLFRKGFVITRDHKFLAVFALFLGGFVGRAILDQVGSAGAFGVGTGIRVLIALGWLFVPAKKEK